MRVDSNLQHYEVGSNWLKCLNEHNLHVRGLQNFLQATQLYTVRNESTFDPYLLPCLIPSFHMLLCQTGVGLHYTHQLSKMALLFAAPTAFWYLFLYRSSFIVFSNAACSFIHGILHQQPPFNCLLFVVISIQYAFLAWSHCLCFQCHSMFIHGWLFVLLHLQKSHEIIYTGRKQRKLTAG